MKLPLASDDGVHIHQYQPRFALDNSAFTHRCWFVHVAVERVGPFAYRAVLAFPRRTKSLKDLLMGPGLPDAWIHR
jgi:hypothetical protein